MNSQQLTRDDLKALGIACPRHRTSEPEAEDMKGHGLCQWSGSVQPPARPQRPWLPGAGEGLS